MRSYTSADGLAADQTSRILADSRGFLWFSTGEGLSRFDGYRFVTFGTSEGLPHRTVNVFLETRAGDYLIGTASGLCRLRSGTGNRISTYVPGSERRQRIITALLEGPSGRIWCGTANGLFELSPGFKFRQQVLTTKPSWDRVGVSDLLEASGGKLWVATPTGIDIVAKDGAIQHLGKAEGLPNEWVNALLRDRTGRLWAATRGGLALLRDGGGSARSGVERVFHDKRGSCNITSLAEAPDGALIMGTGEGITRLPSGAGPPAFEHLTRINGLIDRQIDAVSFDRAGNLWAATEGAGVMKIARAGLTTFTEQDGLASDRIWSVLADRAGTLLAVTVPVTANGMGSVNIFDGAKFHAVVPGVFGRFYNWGDDQVLLQARTGEWWAATKRGLCRFAPGTAADLAAKQPIACYAPDTEVYRIFEDSRGYVWASAQSAEGDRLMRWDSVAKRVSWMQDGPARSPLLVTAFAEDHSRNVWMGLGNAAGLYRYDGLGFARYGQKQGVPPGSILTMLTDRAGRLWIGSTTGLAVIDAPGRAHFTTRLYTVEDGLASNYVQCLVEDADGRIYAGTGKGVDRLEPASGRIKHFSAADGLAHGDMTSAFRDTAGNLWFATKQGLSRLAPQADARPNIPSVRFTDLRVGRDRYPVSQAGDTFISNLTLRPSLNQLQAQFVGFNNEPEER